MKSRSIPFPKLPPRSNGNAIVLNLDLGVNFHKMIISAPDTVKLIKDSKEVELLKRLKAAPVFFSKVIFRIFGIRMNDSL